VHSGKLFRKKTVALILREASLGEEKGQGLRRNLNLRDLTALGIAAIIGAGIFGTIGNAAVSGGPAIMLLFVFTAVACGFSALCYAQFASQIPISGSAYTYAYASFGELVAWIIGWDLIMEYAVGNIAVAISWSDYFSSLMSGLGLQIPACFTVDFLTASRGYREALAAMGTGTDFAALTPALQEAWQAWTGAPALMGVRIIADIPAFCVVVFISWLVYKGIYETKVAGNIMVLLKVAVLLFIIVVGSFYVKPANWSPFAPNGVSGVLGGVAAVFFAYIGFDAISTTAEECRNPRRDLPRAMILSLVITTLLYILISLILTGLVPYRELGVGDPLAYAFQRLNMPWISGVIAVSAVIAMASVLLVFQVGQPRIWMSMSRDGLLPKVFSKVHPRHKTPSFSTVLTGAMVAIPALFLNLTEVTDLTSIGTLFAFVLVSGGVLLLDGRQAATNAGKPAFRVPYFNSRFFLPPIIILVLLLLAWFNPGVLPGFFGDLFSHPTGETFWETFRHKIPALAWLLFTAVMVAVSISKRLSLIPVLGLLTNLYLMTQLGITNWLRFLVWLVVGLCLYFLYGYRNSRLNSGGEGGK